MYREKRFFVWAVVFCAVGLAAGTVAAQDCIYKDEFGEPIMHLGGAALASGVQLMDPTGDLGIPFVYDDWDLNADGIPDKAQFALLTEILCTSAANQHPTIDFEEIQNTFLDNLSLYWTLINTIKAAETAIIAGGPDLRLVGIQLGNAIAAHPTIDGTTPLPPEVFGGTLPDNWVGATWEDLRYVLRETGDGINYMATNGYIGSPTSAIWLLLDNTATAYIMAALWGLDSTFTGNLFLAPELDLLQNFLTLHALDWTYILNEFFAYGLTAATVANAENSIDAIGLDESVMPPPDSLAITSNGEDALHADVLWGDSTFEELYNNNGGDIGVIWDEILTQLPGLPVGGSLALFSLTSILALCGGYAAARRKSK